MTRSFGSMNHKCAALTRSVRRFLFVSNTTDISVIRELAHIRDSAMEMGLHYIATDVAR